MAEVRLTVMGEDKSAHALAAVKNMNDGLSNLDKQQQKVTSSSNQAANSTKNLGREVSSLESKMRSVASVITGVLTTALLGLSIVTVFNKGIESVDSFQQSVIQTAAMITSLQGGDNIATNYQRAKEYADGLQVTLQQVDARTTLNLTNLQQITEEMVKQGVVLDNNNASQVEAFTRIANAVAVYSRNGASEIQVRQEIRALMMGTVDQNSQLAQLLQRTVDGPLKQQVDKWKQSGTLVEELGKRLSGFGMAAEDLNQTWSAVKSSMQTSVDLVLRAGFAGIVKDISTELDKANEYLKTHREEIGEKIQSAWEKVKTVMGGVADVATLIWNNFEPFATIIIGGAIIKGVTSMVEIFTTLYRTLLLVQGSMVAIGALSGTSAGAAAGAAATAGAAGTAAAGGGVMAAIGGGLAATGIAIGGGVGLGYALQPAVRKLDEWLYKKYGWMLTGEAAFNEQTERGKVADQRLSEVMSRRAQGGKSPVPVVNLQDTPEQIKDKMEVMGKELAAYKTLQEQKSALAKGQSDVELTIIKARYSQGLVTTRAYYEEESRLALAAAQTQVDAALLYQRKEEEVLAYVKDKKGEKSAEYQEELARNQKAVSDVQKAQLDYAKTFVDSEAKMVQAMREREAEYAKIIASTIEASGQYVAAEKARQAEEAKSIEMLRLKKEAEEGVKGAIEALAAAEKARATALVEAQNKENADRRQYASDIAAMRDELDKLNGKDEELIASESKLREGREKLLTLQDRIALAWAQGNATAISGLSQQIQLQEQLNVKLQASQAYLEQVKVLNGQIVGFSGNTPIYANGGGAFSNGAPVAGYQSPSLGGSGNFTVVNSNSPFVSLTAPNPFALDGARASGGPVKAYATYRVNEDGTEYLTMGSKGGFITPAGKTPAATQSVQIGDLNFILPNVTNQSSATDFAREAVPEIVKLLNSRFKKVA